MKRKSSRVESILTIGAGVALLAALGAPAANAEIGGVILATPHDSVPGAPAPAPDVGPDPCAVSPPDEGPGAITPVFEPPLNMIVFVPGGPSDPATAGYIVPGAVGGTPLAQLDPKEISRMNATQLSDLTNAAVIQIPAYAFTEFLPTQVNDLDAKQVGAFNYNAVWCVFSWRGSKFQRRSGQACETGSVWYVECSAGSCIRRPRAQSNQQSSMERPTSWRI